MGWLPLLAITKVERTVASDTCHYLTGPTVPVRRGLLPTTSRSWVLQPCQEEGIN